MPFDPRSTKPSRTYRATPREPSGTALFWALVVVAALGAWVFAGRLGGVTGPVMPEQREIVVPDAQSGADPDAGTSIDTSPDDG